MSLYHIVFLMLAAGAVVEHVRKRTPKAVFIALFLVLTAMLCFRFGQGQDYFSYASIYHALPLNPIEALLDQNLHSEPGWKLLCSLMRMGGVPFPGFIFLISVYMMLMLYRFLKLYGGQRKLLVLVICYHTLYMTYYMSVLRQALLIATLLGLLLPWLMERKYIRYGVVCLLLSSIHSVSMLLLLLPVVREIRLKMKQMVSLVIVGFLAGMLLTLIDVGVILHSIVSHPYFAEADVSVVAVAERIVTFCVVTFCYYVYLDGMEPDPKDPLFAIYKAYCIGVLLYGALMWSALISSRTVYVLKVLEIMLVSLTISKCKKSGTIVLCYFLLLSTVLHFKNVGSYLEQGQYQNATVIDYPYVSIFNQKDILNYRQDTINYPFE